VTHIKHSRYGSFCFSNHLGTWTGVAVLFIFSYTSVVLQLSLLFVFFPAVYAMVWLWSILSPYFEKFAISDDSIVISHLQKKSVIALPKEFTLVISYVDVAPPLSVHTAIGNKTHILKDSWGVSILEGLSRDAIIEGLHKNHITKYTSSVIQRTFDEHHYIYGFVCNQALLVELMENGGHTVIVPESLYKKLYEIIENKNVIIDIGY
jgi:hypothetical protein